MKKSNFIRLHSLRSEGNPASASLKPSYEVVCDFLFAAIHRTNPRLANEINRHVYDTVPLKQLHLAIRGFSSFFRTTISTVFFVKLLPFHYFIEEASWLLTNEDQHPAFRFK